MFADLWSDVRYRLRALVRRAALERELDDELRFHLERETEKLERSGLSRAEAYRQARLTFGGVSRTKMDTRDERGVALFEILAQDLRYALRGLRRAPGFTSAVVLTLALGIGANAAMFTVVDRLMFQQPAFLTQPGAVNRVYLSYDNRGSTIRDWTYEYRRYLDFQQWTTSFSQMAAVSVQPMAVGTGDAAVELPVGRASASLFSFFDAAPIIGRFYTERDDALPAGQPVAVISYGYWKSRYGGRMDAVGERVQIGSGSYTIIGVAPEGFTGLPEASPGYTADVAPVAWVPATAYAALQRSNFYQGYHWAWLDVFVRRKPNISVAAATADLTHAYRLSWNAQRALEDLDPIEVSHPTITLGPVQFDRGPVAGPEARVALWISGVALIALLVACANVANLLLARAFGRRREIAVRRAMGVSGSRLVAQLLTESLLLALLGGVAGLAVARFAGSSLDAMLGVSSATGATLVDPRTLVVCAALALFVGLVTGVAAAAHGGRRGDLIGALRAGARDGAYRRSRLRAWLVVAQGALSTALLIGAGLFVRSLNHVHAVPLGFDVDPIVLVERNMRGVKLPADQERLLMQRLEADAKRIPGVVDAAQMLSTPLYDFESTGLYVAGIDSVRKLGRFQMQITTPSFFHTLGTRIIAGRGLVAQDTKAAPRAIVVSAEMARRLWPGRNALGQCIRVGSDSTPCFSVVGIAEDVRQRGISHTPDATYYLAADQVARVPNGLFVRVSGHGTDYAERVRRALQADMPGVSYVTTLPFSDVVGNVERSWRVGALMFAALGGLALALAAIGLYSVIAYGVAQRTNELGIRIALGARMSNLVRLVLREGLALGLIGTAIGALLARVGARWLAPLLFDESPSDPTVYGAVLVTLLLSALVACVVPALRAARVDPNTALRAD
ncbi:MAG: ADOP family duplicated permease [Gemmatimonadales bacterium]